MHSTNDATSKIYCTQDQETMHQRCIAQCTIAIAPTRHHQRCLCIAYQKCIFITPEMQCTEDAVHQKNIATNMQHTIDASHHICSSPKIHTAKEASQHKCITPKIQLTKDKAHQRCSIPGPGPKGLQITPSPSFPPQSSSVL